MNRTPKERACERGVDIQARSRKAACLTRSWRRIYLSILRGITKVKARHCDEHLLFRLLFYFLDDFFLLAFTAFGSLMRTAITSSMTAAISIAMPA